jgi:Predicted nucleotide-binding protein containing TIR-like domain
MPDKRKVFVVHGRNDAIRRDFFSFLRALDLDPVEWSDAANLTGKASAYIGEIIDAGLEAAQAVVVLLTPDDEVRLAPQNRKLSEAPEEIQIRLQPRPNVLYEAGIAMGRYPARTLLVVVGNVKLHSDIQGQHLIRLDNETNQRNEVASRLRTAGCDPNTARSDWLKEGDFTISNAHRQESDTLWQARGNWLDRLGWTLGLLFHLTAISSILALVATIWPPRFDADKVQTWWGAILGRESYIMFLVLCFGALGGIAYGATDLLIGDRTLRWSASYILKPLIGSALALILYMAIRGLFLTSSSGGDINLYGVVAISGIAGLGSDWVARKLQKTVFHRDGS